MSNSHRSLHINFNVLLTDDLNDTLAALAADNKISKAHVVRHSIQRWSDMTYLRTPTCADGQICRCPHAHIYPPSQPPATEGPPPPPGKFNTL